MTTEKDIFASIAEILEDKLGIRAHFISAASPAAQDRFTLSSIARNARASFLISNERLVFPITIEDDFWGAFFIQGAGKYTVEQVAKIQNLITRALTIESENQIHDPIFISSEDVTEEDSQVSCKHLLIQSTSQMSSHETAFAQHEKSARFAFFDASCVSGTNFESVENIKSLGPVTVWINDLSKLNAEQLTNIKSFLALLPQKETPLIVISSTQNLNEFFTDHTVLVQQETESQDNLIWLDQALRTRHHITQDPTIH